MSFHVKATIFSCLVVLVLTPVSTGQSERDPPGHMLPLGSHRPSENPGVDILSSAPLPEEFFSQYVKGNKPFLIRNHAKNMPAFKFWTDDYLRSKYGYLQVDVEQGKKENRSNTLWSMTLEEFLSKYNHSDMYMVNSLPEEMMDEIWVTKSLLCGGFLDDLIDVVTWFSSGDTKSVFHFDNLDNFNCLFDGKKELIMVPKSYVEQLKFDTKGSYSGVDVDRVDLHKYPQFADLPWYNVSMERGDCLFIPYRWAHQVRSIGRNLAINLWFVHQYSFDSHDCEVKGQLPEFAPLRDYGIHGTEGAQFRSELLLFAAERGALTMEDVNSAVQYLGVDEDDLNMIFKLADSNRDQKVTIAELEKVNSAVLEEFLELLTYRQDGMEAVEFSTINDIKKEDDTPNFETNKSEL